MSKAVNTPQLRPHWATPAYVVGSGGCFLAALHVLGQQPGEQIKKLKPEEQNLKFSLLSCLVSSATARSLPTPAVFRERALLL